MRTLLIIDDNPSVRDTLAIVLGASGYHVVTADTGEAGLDLARQQPIDGAIVDIRMVGLDGVKVCRELQAQAQVVGRRLPVWLMTGAYSAEVAAMGKEAGAVAVLRKPFDLPSLCQELESQWAADATGGAVGGISNATAP